MVSVSVATFVVGADAVKDVRQYLESLSSQPRDFGRRTTNSLNNLAESFDHLLATSAEGFDTQCQLRDCRPTRVVWQGQQKTAGALFLARDGELKTISLLLSGVNPKADVAAIEQMGRALSPIDAYYESLAIVRFATRPLVATFCSRGGGIDQTIDQVQLAFAGVFFHRCGVALNAPDNADRMRCMSAH
jgi:hypothetical protein